MKQLRTVSVNPKSFEVCMNNDHKPYGVYEKYIKRLLDCALSSIAIIILFPLFIVIAIVVRMSFGRPVFFMQDRPGKNEKIFKLFKFRTMSNAIDDQGNLLPESLRLNKAGRILRGTSLDELPELFNIMKGEMSFIGPRPLLVSYLDYYTEEERHRHDVRPGLSGLAQVNGRSFISWEEIFGYDLQYVNKITFLGDCKILFLTVKKVLMKSDIADYADNLESTKNCEPSSNKKQRKIHKALDEEREINNG